MGTAFGGSESCPGGKSIPAARHARTGLPTERVASRAVAIIVVAQVVHGLHQGGCALLRLTVDARDRMQGDGDIMRIGGQPLNGRI